MNKNKKTPRHVCPSCRHARLVQAKWSAPNLWSTRLAPPTSSQPYLSLILLIIWGRLWVWLGWVGWGLGGGSLKIEHPTEGRPLQRQPSSFQLEGSWELGCWEWSCSARQSSRPQRAMENFDQIKTKYSPVKSSLGIGFSSRDFPPKHEYKLTSVLTTVVLLPPCGQK